MPVRSEDQPAIQTMRAGWGITDPLPVTDEHRKSVDGRISTYHFAEILGGLLKDDDVLATGCSGLAVEIFHLSVPVEPDRDIITSWSLGAMGFGLPVAIGACIGSGRKHTVLVESDGSLALSVSELATIRGLDLPIKVFVLNNLGYQSMAISQSRWFGRTFGADESTGLYLPLLEEVAGCYGLPYVLLDARWDLAEQVEDVLDADCPVLCEVPSPFNESRPSKKQSGDGWVPVERFR